MINNIYQVKDGFKRCKNCKKVLAITCFQKDSGSHDGLYYWCRVCNNARVCQYYKEHLAERKAYARKYNKKNRERIRVKCKLYTKLNKKKVKGQKLMQAYGITLNDYAELLKQQKGVCAICGALPENEYTGYLSVDHNHKTGHVRGLLCSACNKSLALFDKGLLLNALTYLRGCND